MDRSTSKKMVVYIDSFSLTDCQDKDLKQEEKEQQQEVNSKDRSRAQ